MHTQLAITTLQSGLQHSFSILYVSDGTYSLTSTPNNRFLRNFFMTVFNCSQSCCQKSAEGEEPGLLGPS